MALYVQPVLWVVLAIFALIGLKFIWLTLVGKFMGARQLLEHQVGDKGLTARSHCPRSHHYKHPCFLQMRQVQPG
jgi:hypothetical protein